MEPQNLSYFSIFTIWYSFGIINPFHEYLMLYPVRKDFNAFYGNLHWCQDSKVFPSWWILIGQFKFQAHCSYARRVFVGWSIPSRGGVLLEKLGRGVRPASQNPSPIYDKKFVIFPTLFMIWPKTWHPIYDLTLRSLGEGLFCWLYLACVAGIEQRRGRQSADGRRRAWWKSGFF